MIGIAAAYGMLLAVANYSYESQEVLGDYYRRYDAKFRHTKPTTVNLFYALEADYHSQLSAKGGLYPVVTLVLYFGDDPWTAPRSLYERVQVPGDLRPFVSDHRINVFEISFLTDEQTERFTSDFRIVVDYFVSSDRKSVV